MEIGIRVGDGPRIIKHFEGSLLPFAQLIYPVGLSIPVEELARADFVCVDLEVQDLPWEETSLVNNTQCLNLNLDPVVKPYPNPATDRLSISLILPEKDHVSLKFFNSDGRLLMEKTLASTVVGLNQVNIDAYPYRKGIYFLQVIYRGTMQVHRIFIK